MRYVDIPLYCDNCSHLKYEGDIMVGSDSTGGGPEPSYSCRKGRNMSYYYANDKRCPDCNSFDDDDYDYI